MNFSLLLLYDELDAIKLFHGSSFTLSVSLDLFLHFYILILRIGKVSECEDLLCFFTTWVSS